MAVGKTNTSGGFDEELMTWVAVQALVEDRFKYGQLVEGEVVAESNWATEMEMFHCLPGDGWMVGVQGRARINVGPGVDSAASFNVANYSCDRHRVLDPSSTTPAFDI